MREIWKPIPGYLNYKVSNLGRVKSIDRCVHKNGDFRNGHILKPIKKKRGYLEVNLSERGKRKACKIHRLVMLAFVGDCPEGIQVNHIDEDKTNNRLDNLEYVTQIENCNHGTRNERLSKILKGRKRSEETRKRIKASAMKRAKAVMCVETKVVFPSAGIAEAATGIKKIGISHVCSGRQHTAGGYHWRYVA